ncbi:MAG: hypothetical protein P4L31_03020 [Candidatus Babeliales bacterium]|nr:hypothetical protein [Candidatus Babeliales bacterium]
MNIKKTIIICGLIATNLVMQAGFGNFGKINRVDKTQVIKAPPVAPADACAKIAGVDAMGGNIKASWGVPASCKVIDVSEIVGNVIIDNKGPTNPTFASAGSPTILLPDPTPGQVKTLTITTKLGSCAPFTWAVKEGEPLWSSKAMDAFNHSDKDSQNPGFISRNMKFATQVGLGAGCGLMGGGQGCNSSNQCRGHCDYTCKGVGDYPDENCCNWWGPVEDVSHNVSSSLAKRAQECAWLTADSSELAATISAKVTADGVLEAAKQTSAGVLTGAGAATKGILTAVDQVVNQLMNTFNVKHIKYQGNLQSMATGNLGNVECSAVILNQKVNFKFDLNVHQPAQGIADIVNKLVDACTKEIKKAAKI